jgi:hypothetical protein
MVLRAYPNPTHDESNEGINVKNNKQPKQDSTEPYYYVALVIKGTEKQYLNLLKYVNNRNGAQVIYQCKSLTYLRVCKDEAVNLKDETPITIQAQGAEL